MDLQDLEIFVRVAAVQNLSAVGQELGLTPGTISKRLQALEVDLEVRLFDRTTRSIRITDEGERFLVHAQRVLHEMDQARTALASRTSTPVGRLKIAAPELLGHESICAAVNAFVETYPQISVQLDLTDKPVNLHEEGYDVVIHTGDLGDSSLIAKKLTTDRRICVASPLYIEKHGAPMIPADIATHKCLALGDTYIWSFARSREEEELIRINVALRSTSNEVLRRAAVAGAGLFWTTEMQVSSDLAQRQLVQVLADAPDADDVGVYALYLSGRHALPRLRTFLDHLGDHFREVRPEGGSSTSRPLRASHGSRLTTVSR